MELTRDNYYGRDASERYFSVSQYKDFCGCEAAALARIRGGYRSPPTRAMLVGSFVDAWAEGTLEAFKRENPDVFTRKKELKAEFRKANEIIGRIRADPLFTRFLSGEKQKILTFELFGVPWKMKMDSFLEDICVTDLKVVANFRNLALFRYDLQGAVYQEGARLNGFGQLPFYLAAATKERVVNLDVFQIPQATLDMALREIGERMGRFADVKRGFAEPEYCGVCDYCKSVKRARIRNYNELLEG